MKVITSIKNIHSSYLIENLIKIYIDKKKIYNKKIEIEDFNYKLYITQKNKEFKLNLNLYELELYIKNKKKLIKIYKYIINWVKDKTLINNNKGSINLSITYSRNYFNSWGKLIIILISPIDNKQIKTTILFNKNYLIQDNKDALNFLEYQDNQI